MTAQITWHFVRTPLIAGQATKVVDRFSDADLFLSIRRATIGQLWERVEEGNRDD